MSTITPLNSPDFNQKSFWKRPEGVTGAIFLTALIAGGGFLLYTFWVPIMNALGSVLAMTLMGIALVAILYMVLDPKTRNLFWYMYKSMMRWVTGIFVQIDPIGILKSYVEDLEDNLAKMRRQISNLRKQMRELENFVKKNLVDMDKSLKIAAAAKAKGDEKQVMLNTRKAARLKETNEKYNKLLKRMQVLHRILRKMDENSEIIIEDTRDQVKVKEQERRAIRASHSAMKSAMNVMSGDPDKRAMFDMALEAIADDLNSKVGEMERFMELSANFMDSVDLQNGVFEEEGLKMLERYEKESTLMLMSSNKKSEDSLDLNSPVAQPEKRGEGNNYDNLFG